MSVIKLLKRIRSRLSKIGKINFGELDREEMIFIASVYSKHSTESWTYPTLGYRAFDQFSWKDRN